MLIASRDRRGGRAAIPRVADVAAPGRPRRRSRPLQRTSARRAGARCSQQLLENAEIAERDSRAAVPGHRHRLGPHRARRRGVPLRRPAGRDRRGGRVGVPRRQAAHERRARRAASTAPTPATTRPPSSRSRIGARPGTGATVHVMLKGGGSDNASRVEMLPPGAGIEGVRRVVLEAVEAEGDRRVPAASGRRRRRRDLRQGGRPGQDALCCARSARSRSGRASRRSRPSFSRRSTRPASVPRGWAATPRRSPCTSSPRPATSPHCRSRSTSGARRYARRRSRWARERRIRRADERASWRDARRRRPHRRGPTGASWRTAVPAALVRAVRQRDRRLARHRLPDAARHDALRRLVVRCRRHPDRQDHPGARLQFAHGRHGRPVRPPQGHDHRRPGTRRARARAGDHELAVGHLPRGPTHGDGVAVLLAGAQLAHPVPGGRGGRDRRQRAGLHDAAGEHAHRPDGGHRDSRRLRGRRPRACRREPAHRGQLRGARSRRRCSARAPA